MQGGVRAMEIIVVEVEREEGGAVEAGVIGTSISPLAREGLDEAFGLAVGLRAIGTSEEMLDAQLAAGSGEEFGAISGAAIGEDGLDGDAMVLIKSEGLLECREDTGDFFVWEQRGKSEAGMIIDGDVEGLGAGAWIAMGTVAGGADAGLEKAAKLFNIKMKQLAGSGALVTKDGRLGRIESRQAIEAMALEDAGKGSFGDGKNHEDLGVGTALATEGEDLGFELGRRLARLASGDGGTILQPVRRAGELGTDEPLADGFFADAESVGRGAEGSATGEVMVNQFGSRERGECGISVHSDRAGWLGVESASTTNLPDPRSADNVLKHDT